MGMRKWKMTSRKKQTETMSLAEVVRRSGFSEATIRRHIKKGLLKAEKPGGLYGSYLVDVKSYQKWVKGQNT